MEEDEEKRLRRLISEAEAGVGQDSDLPPTPAETWLRLWWQTLRAVLPAPRH